MLRLFAEKSTKKHSKRVRKNPFERTYIVERLFIFHLRCTPIPTRGKNENKKKEGVKKLAVFNTLNGIVERGKWWGNGAFTL